MDVIALKHGPLERERMPVMISTVQSKVRFSLDSFNGAGPMKKF